jgi:outer membrane biosynthesis protein TonB
VTTSESNVTSSTEKFVLRALVISVILHLLLFSLWRVGQAQGWWRNLTMPRWMQLVSKAIMPVPPKNPPMEIPSQSQLTFVEVDPAQAVPEPPKDAKFQGAKNTLAANREIKTPSDRPDVDGGQDQFLKTIADAPPKPLAAAPTPPPAPTPAPTPPPTSTPPPTPPPTPTPPANIPQQNAPQKTLAPGDLTTARPSNKPQDGKEKSDADTASQPQPQPYERPRTLEEARARSGNYGKQSRIVGGVPRIGIDPSLDVKGTPLGDYLAHMVDAVGDHWHKLLEHESADLSGKVVLHFRLHSDGTVTDVKPLKNEVGDVLESVCERGVKEPAPFGKWPPEMLLEISKDYYDITFTFFYELY